MFNFANVTENRILCWNILLLRRLSVSDCYSLRDAQEGLFKQTKTQNVNGIMKKDILIFYFEAIRKRLLNVLFKEYP